jgi:hypothetical protein
MSNDGSPSCEMDPEKVRRIYPNTLFPDIFRINVMKVKIRRRQKNTVYTEDVDDIYRLHTPDSYCFEPVVWRGEEMRQISIGKLLAYLTEVSKSWFELQRSLVASGNPDMKLCPGCNVACEHCVCARPHSGSKNDDVDSDSITIFKNEDEDDGVSISESKISGEHDNHPTIITTQSLNNEYLIVDRSKFGRIPKFTTPGNYPCSLCGSKCDISGLYVCLDSKNDQVRICRKCLAITRVTCDKCLRLPIEQTKMKRQPKQVVKCAEKFCLNCKSVKTESGTKSVHEFIDEFVLEYTSTVNVEKTLKITFESVIINYLIGGYEGVVEYMNKLSIGFSLECGNFVSKLISRLLDLAYAKGLLTWEMWVPRTIEATPVMEYLYEKFGYAKYVKRADDSIGIISLLSFLMMKFDSFSYRNLLGIIPLTYVATNFAPASWLVRYILNKISYGDYVRLVLTFKKIVKFAKRSKQPALATFLLTFLHTIYRYKPDTWIHGGNLWKISIMLIMLIIKKMKRRDMSLRRAITRFWIKSKTNNPVRDEILPSVGACYIIGKLGLIGNNVLYTILDKYRLNPQADSEMPIVDYASLSGMARYWYKKQWYNANLDPLPVSITSNHVELKNAVCKNLLHVLNTKSGESCDAFAICSRMILLPHHQVSKKRAKYIFTRKDDLQGVCGNARFSCNFSLDDCKYYGGDLVVVEVPKSGDFADMSKYFMDNSERLPPFGSMIYRRSNGCIEVNEVVEIKHNSRCTNNHCIIPGDSSSKVYFNGMSYISSGVGRCRCMSVVLAVENPSAILGFHLGGDDNNYGVGAVLTKSDIVRFKDAFSVSPSHILLPESGTFRQQQYGVNCVIQGVHPNSVAAHMKDGEYKLFGSTGFVGKDSSRVVRTPIDEDVRSICGIKVEWDKPKLEGFGDNPSRKDKWLAWTDSITHTADEVPRDVLDAAVSDYTNGIISYIKHNPPDIMRPLNDFEVVCGVQDVEFIEPLESSTSIGFPLGGSKRKWMELRKDELGQWRNMFTTNMFMESAKYIEDAYVHNKRVYSVYKSFPKDTPTEVGKDKVRIVNGAPIDNQIVTRRHLACFVKYMCENSDVTECSVGINPYAHKWHDMRQRLLRNGNNIMALDYSKFDTRMSSQIVLAAFACIAHIMAFFYRNDSFLREYTMKIISGLAADTAWPVVCVNGDIIMLQGGIVSGNSMTAILNSICNSILLRIAYFHIYPSGIVQGWFSRQVLDFRSGVILYVYGDDLLGSVSRSVHRYNNRIVGVVLGEYGYVLTAFDKVKTPPKFYAIKDVEFLKRSFKWHPELGMYTCPLNEKSIFKRLCCVLKPVSPNTMEGVLASNLRSSMMEFFFHGRRLYELRSKQLKKVCSKIECPIMRGICMKTVSSTYEERLVEWQDNYLCVRFKADLSHTTTSTGELSLQSPPT